MIPGLIGAINALLGRLDGHGFYWESDGDNNLSGLVDRLSNPENPERKVIRRLLQELKPQSILDVACGPATELQGYMEHAIPISYTGLDKSQYMLDIASKRFPENTFVRGEAETLPFEDNSFDAVLLKHLLEHLESYEAAVKEATRVAKDIVIIDFFHRLLPVNIPVWQSAGYWDNWYSRRGFEKFLSEQPISSYERTRTEGTSGRTAEIYLLVK